MKLRSSEKVKIKCGVDLVDNNRFKEGNINEEFLKKVFSLVEVKEGKLASSFVLKEAVIKALELPAGSWKEIEVTHKNNGKTTIQLSEQIKPKNLLSIDSSISHQGSLTIGFVTILFSE